MEESSSGTDDAVMANVQPSASHGPPAHISKSDDQHDDNIGNVASLTLSTLTDETLLEVLYHLHPFDVLTRVAFASRRFAALTTSRDPDLRYWRYHPKLPDRIRARVDDKTTANTTEVDAKLEAEDKVEAMSVETMEEHKETDAKQESRRPVSAPCLTRYQLQLLCCLCCDPTTSTCDIRSFKHLRALRKVDLLPSREVAMASAEAYKHTFRHAAEDGRRSSGRHVIASTEDHEHESLVHVLRSRGRRLRAGHGHGVRGPRRRHPPVMDQGEDDPRAMVVDGTTATDDDDEEEEESETEEDEHGEGGGGGGRRGRRGPGDNAPMSRPGVPNDRYDEMFLNILNSEQDYGPHSMDGHVTLQFFMRVMGQEGSYWSSRPSEDRDSVESLIFATQNAEDAAIDHVAVKPFRELRLDDTHVPFTWPEAVVSVYRLPVAEDVSGESEKRADMCSLSLWSDGKIIDPLAVIPHGNKKEEEKKDGSNECDAAAASAGENPGSTESLLAGHKPVYVSEPLEADSPNDTGWQTFQLPEGVIGNVVVLSLRGKYNRQFSESGYYCCVERVECCGVLLPKRPIGETAAFADS